MKKVADSKFSEGRARLFSDLSRLGLARRIRRGPGLLLAGPGPYQFHAVLDII